jgi:hypothetical protein
MFTTNDMRKQADAVFSVFTNDQKGPVHLKIVLRCWSKPRAYWGKYPSSYTAKICPGITDRQRSQPDDLVPLNIFVFIDCENNQFL